MIDALGFVSRSVANRFACMLACSIAPALSPAAVRASISFIAMAELWGSAAARWRQHSAALSVLPTRVSTGGRTFKASPVPPREVRSTVLEPDVERRRGVHEQSSEQIASVELEGTHMVVARARRLDNSASHRIAAGLRVTSSSPRRRITASPR